MSKVVKYNFDYAGKVKAFKALEALNEEDTINLCRRRIQQGILLREVIGSEDRYGKGLVDTFAIDVGVRDVKGLYKAHAAAKELAYDIEAFELYVDNYKAKKRKLTLTGMYKELINPDKNPEAVGGMENHAEAMAYDMEQLSEKIEVASKIHANNPQIEGAIQASLESLTESAQNLMQAIKPGDLEEQFTTKFFRRWMAETQPCMISGNRPCDPHHVIYQSKGAAASDLFAIPLSRPVHDEYHKLGAKKFASKYQIKTELLVIQNLQNFLLWVEDLLKSRNIHPFGE